MHPIRPADPLYFGSPGLFQFRDWPVAEFGWRGRGPEYELFWAGAAWRVRLDGPRPGLELVDSDQCSALALEGLAAVGRSSGWDAVRPTLAKCGRIGGRVEAVYTIDDWGGLTIRAGWSLARDVEAVDLEVQITADSVGVLFGLEVQAATRLRDVGRPPTVGAGAELVVEPRDRESASLSYDGREPTEVLRRLSTRPIPARIGAGFAPSVVEAPWLGAAANYLEMVHPVDVARRIVERGALPAGGAVRYGLFGHDLEKGVVLRARLRGRWRRVPVQRDEIDREFREFRDAPPPLGP